MREKQEPAVSSVPKIQKIITKSVNRISAKMGEPNQIRKHMSVGSRSAAHLSAIVAGSSGTSVAVRNIK